MAVDFLSPSRTSFFIYVDIEVIYESSVWVSGIRTASSKIEECAKTFNSTW